MTLEKTVEIMIEGISQSGPVRQYVLALGRETLAMDCARRLRENGLNDESKVIETAEGIDATLRGFVPGYPRKPQDPRWAD